MKKYIVARKNIVSVVLVLAVVITSIVCMAPKTVEAASATYKLNKSSVSVDIGKTYTLKVLTKTKYQDAWTGEWFPCWADKKTTAKWSTSNKKIATVSSKGKVTGKKAGTCTVTAKVGSKSYKCKITVKRPVSKNLLVIKSVATAKNYYCGSCYRIKNTNDYTVEFQLEVYYYDENSKLIQKNNGGYYILGVGETTYAMPNGLGDLYDPMKTTDYGKAKPVIKNLKKSDNKTAIKDIKVSLNEAGDCVTVTNNSNITVTRLYIDCWRINDNKQIEMVIGLTVNDFSENGLKPGKSYTCKVNKPDSNWEGAFGDWIQIGEGLGGYTQPGKPDRMVIVEASDRENSTISVN